MQDLPKGLEQILLHACVLSLYGEDFDSTTQERPFAIEKPRFRRFDFIDSCYRVGSIESAQPDNLDDLVVLKMRMLLPDKDVVLWQPKEELEESQPQFVSTIRQT